MAKILVSLPDELLESVDAAAASESRTRTELVREAIRRYLADAPTGAGDELRWSTSERASHSVTGRRKTW
jgi:metal-responsive CopG/Arc/MetJ family transcriptional regulator